MRRNIRGDIGEYLAAEAGKLVQVDARGVLMADNSHHAKRAAAIIEQRHVAQATRNACYCDIDVAQLQRAGGSPRRVGELY